MKRCIMKCPTNGVDVIVPVHESFAIPREGTVVRVRCPCCRLSHDMAIREPAPAQHAS